MPNDDQKQTFEDRVEEKLNADVLTSIKIATNGVGMVLENLRQIWEVSKIMAGSGPAVPPTFRSRPFLCFAVAQQANRWMADPWAVAQKAYVTKDKGGNERIAYEAQLVNAIVNTRAPLQSRLTWAWEGKGEELVCTVAGLMKGEKQPKSLRVEIKGIDTRNSPLWKAAPEIQLGYWVSRAWARLYCPEVILGIYTPDELEAGMTDLNPADRPARPTPDDYTKELKVPATIDATATTVPEKPAAQAAIAPPSETPIDTTAVVGNKQPELVSVQQGLGLAMPEGNGKAAAPAAAKKLFEDFTLVSAEGEIIDAFEDAEHYANIIVSRIASCFNQKQLDTFIENNTKDIGRLNIADQRRITETALARGPKLPKS